METNRRGFLRSAYALPLAWAFTPGVFAQELLPTPQQTAGPFFPDPIPLDRDNDLIIVENGLTPAMGQVVHLGGRILDRRGDPVRGALVELWQVDAHGSYLHRGGRQARRDSHFQGYGAFETASTGGYRFRTIKPVPYPGRTPHIHLAVTVPGRSRFTTQCYVRGEPQNASDAVLNGIRDRRRRESVIVDFRPVESSRVGELAGTFDIVLDFTPES